MTDYFYDGTIIRWVDGDTLWLTVWKEVDFGFRARMRFEHDLECRMYGIDTPEHSAGKPATARVNELAPAGSQVKARTYKDPDKYGRWLAAIVLPDQTCINVVLLNEGLAKPYFGGKK